MYLDFFSKCLKGMPRMLHIYVWKVLWSLGFPLLVSDFHSAVQSRRVEGRTAGVVPGPRKNVCSEGQGH